MGIKHSIFKNNKENFLGQFEGKPLMYPWIKVYFFNQELENQIYKNNIFQNENYSKFSEAKFVCCKATLSETNLLETAKISNIKSFCKKSLKKILNQTSTIPILTNSSPKKIVSIQNSKISFLIINKINKLNLFIEINIVYSVLNEFTLFLNKLVQKPFNHSNAAEPHTNLGMLNLDVLKFNKYYKSKKNDSFFLFHSKLELIYINLVIQYKLNRDGYKYLLNPLKDSFFKPLTLKNLFLLQKPTVFFNLEVLKYWLFYFFNKKNQKLHNFKSINQKFLYSNQSQLFLSKNLFQSKIQFRVLTKNKNLKKNLSNIYLKKTKSNHFIFFSRNFKKKVFFNSSKIKNKVLAKLESIQKQTIKKNLNKKALKKGKSTFKRINTAERYRRFKSNNLIKNLFYRYWLVSCLKPTLTINWNKPYFLINKNKLKNYFNNFSSLKSNLISSLEICNKKSIEKINLNQAFLFLQIKQLLFYLYLKPKFILHFQFSFDLKQKQITKNLKVPELNKTRKSEFVKFFQTEINLNSSNIFFIQPFISVQKSIENRFLKIIYSCQINHFTFNFFKNNLNYRTNIQSQFCFFLKNNSILTERQDNWNPLNLAMLNLYAAKFSYVKFVLKTLKRHCQFVSRNKLKRIQYYSKHFKNNNLNIYYWQFSYLLIIGLNSKFLIIKKKVKSENIFNVVYLIRIKKVNSIFRDLVNKNFEGKITKKFLSFFNDSSYSIKLNFDMILKFYFLNRKVLKDLLPQLDFIKLNSIFQIKKKQCRLAAYKFSIAKFSRIHFNKNLNFKILDLNLFKSLNEIHYLRKFSKYQKIFPLQCSSAEYKFRFSKFNRKRSIQNNPALRHTSLAKLNLEEHYFRGVEQVNNKISNKNCILEFIWNQIKSSSFVKNISFHTYNHTFYKLENKNKTDFNFKRFSAKESFSIKFFEIFNQNFFLKQSKNYFLYNKSFSKFQTIFKIQNYILSKNHSNLINQILILYIPVNKFIRNKDLNKEKNNKLLKYWDSKNKYFSNKKKIRIRESFEFLQKIKQLNPFLLTKIELNKVFLKLYTGQSYFFKKLQFKNSLVNKSFHAALLHTNLAMLNLNKSNLFFYDSSFGITKNSFLNIYINNSSFLKNKNQFFFILNLNPIFKLNLNYFIFLNKNFFLIISRNKKLFKKKEKSIKYIIKKFLVINKNYKIFEEIKKLKKIFFYSFFPMLIINKISSIFLIIQHFKKLISKKQFILSLKLKQISNLVENQNSYVFSKQIKYIKLKKNSKIIKSTNLYSIYRIYKSKFILSKFFNSQEKFLKANDSLKILKNNFYKLNSNWLWKLSLKKFFILFIQLKSNQLLFLKVLYFYIKFDYVFKDIGINNKIIISKQFQNKIKKCSFLTQNYIIINKLKKNNLFYLIKRFLSLSLKKKLKLNNFKFVMFLNCFLISQKISNIKYKLMDWEKNIFVKPFKKQVNILKLFLVNSFNFKGLTQFLYKLNIVTIISIYSYLNFLFKKTYLIKKDKKNFISNSYDFNLKKYFEIDFFSRIHKNLKCEFKNYFLNTKYIINFLLIGNKRIQEKQFYFFNYFFKLTNTYFIFNYQKINDYFLKNNLFNKFSKNFFKKTLNIYGILLKTELKTSSLYYGENLLLLYKNLRVFKNSKNVFKTFLNKAIIIKQLKLFKTNYFKRNAKSFFKNKNYGNSLNCIFNGGFPFYGFYIYQKIEIAKNPSKFSYLFSDFNDIKTIKFSFLLNLSQVGIIEKISNKLIAQYDFVYIKSSVISKLKIKNNFAAERHTNLAMLNLEDHLFLKDLNKFNISAITLYKNKNCIENSNKKMIELIKLNFNDNSKFQKNKVLNYFNATEWHTNLAMLNLEEVNFINKNKLLKKKILNYFFKLNLSKIKNLNKSKFLFNFKQNSFYNKEIIKKLFLNYFFIDEINLVFNLNEIVKTHFFYQVKINEGQVNIKTFFYFGKKNQCYDNFYKTTFIKNNHFKKVIKNPVQTKIIFIKENFTNHTDQIRSFFFKFQGKKQELLIKIISPIIHKWSDYYKQLVINFNYLNFLLIRILWNWCFKRHNNVSNKWIKEKYFLCLNNKKYVFATSFKERYRIPNYNNKHLINQKDINPICENILFKTKKNLLETEKFFKNSIRKNGNEKNNIKITIHNRIKKNFLIMSKYC